MGGIHLSPGTYWLVWQADGSLGSGPWAPPITITGQAVTGNALRSLDNSVTWEDVLDNGSGDAQGFPFVIRSAAAIPTLSEYGMITFLLLLSGITLVMRRRKQTEV